MFTYTSYNYLPKHSPHLKTLWDKLSLPATVRNHSKSDVHTILRSPHVNKTARDQIKIQEFKQIAKLQAHPQWVMLYALYKGTLGSAKSVSTHVFKQTLYFGLSKRL